MDFYFIALGRDGKTQKRNRKLGPGKGRKKRKFRMNVQIQIHSLQAVYNDYWFKNEQWLVL